MAGAAKPDEATGWGKTCDLILNNRDLILRSALPKSGLPDFGTQRGIEIGNSRFRLRGEVVGERKRDGG